jgi:predicted GIY-YIG superfamily endonuclease
MQARRSPSEAAGRLHPRQHTYATLYIGVKKAISPIASKRIGTAARTDLPSNTVHTLVYFEVHAGMYEAIQREKRLKK